MIEKQDWGIIDYQEAWDKQRELVADIQTKRNRSVLVLCEHPSVITIGKTGSQSNVVSNPSFLESLGIKVVEIDRGGDVTLHNPGQLVGYPIFDLMTFKQDLHWFLREIEECIIELIALYGLKGHRIDGLTGVWIENKRKICAIGMHCSRWVTSHGFALNVNNNLDEFTFIVPCGITNKEVTSIGREIGTHIDMDIIKDQCTNIFQKRFQVL